MPVDDAHQHLAEATHDREAVGDQGRRIERDVERLEEVLGLRAVMELGEHQATSARAAVAGARSALRTWSRYQASSAASMGWKACAVTGSIPAPSSWPAGQ